MLKIKFTTTNLKGVKASSTREFATFACAQWAGLDESAALGSDWLVAVSVKGISLGTYCNGGMIA